MLPVDAYSPDYATARARFRSAIAERGWHHEAHIVRAPGFADDELTIDAARAGPLDADRLLILSSGLHGAEGFFGSAAQLAWIDSLPKSWMPPPGCAVLLLHALNPFGFAKIRRANEDNVDLNRNFLPAEAFAALKESTQSEYAPLDPFLNPPFAPGRFNWFPLIFLRAVIRFGMSMLTRVIPAGQYAFPKGIFYGGEKPCRPTEIVMREMPRWVGSARTVIHLDFHTGLGKWGEYELLSAEPLGARRVKLAERFFGWQKVKHHAATEGGYYNHGDMGEWLCHRFAAEDYLYLCAEFGTYGGARVIGSLRRENQAHHWESPDSWRYQSIKAGMLNTFTPFSAAWRWRVVRQAIELVELAVRICAK